MEQGSSSAKSPANPSKQRRMSFSDELSAIINSSTQDLSMERETRDSNAETKEYRPTRPSFSRGPLQGGMLSQFHGGNEDLSAAAYLHANEQLFRARKNPRIPRDQEEQEYYDDAMMMNRYNLSSSNLPPDYHRSMPRGVQIGSSQTLVPFESSMIDPLSGAYWAAEAQNSAMAPHSSVPLRSMPYQLNTPSPTTLRTPYQNTSDQLATQSCLAQNVESSFLRSIGAQGTAYPSAEFDDGSSSSGRLKRKRRMPSQDDATPNHQGWNSFARALHRYGSSSNSNGGSYSLYDKRYEEVGLPMDPHLRIFIAAKANGNGESSSRRND